ncbi:cAMP-dependent protein kinase inhibitor alpha [Grus japonensis]|uniref:cAMP-dependent protein kinase inhibitor alpha n=1 Tax=Grus japonensis TaxID=30415 RepID=A0ABC9Y447_GRUJA
MDYLVDKELVGWSHPETSGSVSGWRLVMSSVPLGSVFGSVLFNIFINDIVGSSAPSANLQMTLSGVVDMPEGQDAIQRDLDKLEKWACVNLMRFNKARCKVLHLGMGNLRYQYRLGNEGIKSNPTGKDSGILVDEKLDVNCNVHLQARKPTVSLAM